MTKAEELINKHLIKECGGDLGIAGGNIYKACLGAVNEALSLSSVGCSLPSKEEIKLEANKYSDINGIICADENWVIDKHEAFIDGAEFVVNRMR